MFKNSLPPRPVKLAGVLGTVEAVLIALYGVMLMVVGVLQEHLPVANSLMLGGFFIVIAATLVWAVRMLVQGKSSGRSLLLVWQLMIVIVGVQVVVGGRWLIGLVALLLAAPTLLLLFSRDASQFIVEETERRHAQQ
ncbi:hypothetical protein [Rothia aerolata]|uniref:Uncharacterized protein n=1 Tax=Rothia aerolata TaxID=1812262 RepID=A0A917MRS7_9MICC|nr:hypothetical protein [Rothia aerolata]GGH59458.1 hypothetical protein GCM10007359_06670 [Rothia aerolata]